MVRQSRPKSRSCAPAAPSRRRSYYSTTTPAHSLFVARHLHHVASISLPFSAASAYFLSPPGCTPHAHQIFSASVPARPAGEPDWVGAANPMFSAVCRLFIALCALFDTRSLFSIVCRLFFKTPGWGYLRSILLGAALPGGRLKLRANNCYC